MSVNAIEDARILFDNYIDTTKGIERCTGDKKPFLYPQGPTEVDMLVFAAVFSHVWQAIGEKNVFATHYAAKRPAFQDRVHVTTAESEFHPYTCFWEQDGTSLKKADATTEGGCVRSVARFATASITSTIATWT